MGWSVRFRGFSMRPRVSSVTAPRSASSSVSPSTTGDVARRPSSSKVHSLTPRVRVVPSARTNSTWRSGFKRSARQSARRRTEYTAPESTRNRTRFARRRRPVGLTVPSMYVRPIGRHPTTRRSVAPWGRVLGWVNPLAFRRSLQGAWDTIRAVRIGARSTRGRHPHSSPRGWSRAEPDGRWWLQRESAVCRGARRSLPHERCRR